jgi:hypothetical protein
MMAGQNGEIPSSLALRDSQAGPHKCERINPSTGKPCNSIFSRPYDLTRHEGTIHNTRKQKLRCHLCSEEKTFTRDDALTRHMRVVHPEVPLPRKQRRKGPRLWKLLSKRAALEKSPRCTWGRGFLTCIVLSVVCTIGTAIFKVKLDSTSPLS